ncbi:hypothetical protein [Lactobacillus kalixensis]|uniref:hypothetical protein n=1 Tax=Lactobacillus kalixensis TaxID=227944 RepID=UPI00070CD9A1|nr:hypothetical protein [Lactobacillus kalixensis]
MKDEILMIYRILAVVIMVLVLTLIFLVKPIGYFNEAICFLLLISLMIADIKIILQTRKIKKEQ